MSFRSADLSCLAYANGFSHWHYRTNDSAADAQSPGYFDAASRMLRVGDIILVNVRPCLDGQQSLLVVIEGNDHGRVIAATMAASPPIRRAEPAVEREAA